jgi:SAM-dependent methyltransferase
MSMSYTQIAKRFDITRAYVWPCVKRFLELCHIHTNTNTTVFEAGCGNGRNLIYAKKLGYAIVEGMDICQEFVDICCQKNLNVHLGDILEPMNKKYNVILSVAVIHHLDTETKRLTAIRNLIDGLLPGGVLFFTVWSFEKGESTFQKDFQLGDNIVPWRSRKSRTILENRYYYIYNKETLENTLNQMNIPYTLDWEEQNWIVMIRK